MTDNWYQYSTEELCRILMTDAQTGLTGRFAAKKYKKFGPNVIYPISRLSFSTYVRHVATDFTSLLMIIVALITAIFEQNIAGYLMIALIVFSLGFSIFTYAKAQKILESLEGYTLPVAKCIRQGKLYMMAQKKLVPGDLILLSEGDVVPADARLIESENLYCRENILFGFESPVKKDASFPVPPQIHLEDSEQKNMVFADSIVTSGHAKAIVCETGSNTAVWRRRRSRSLVSHEKLSVLKILKRYSRFWSVTAIAITFVCILLSLLVLKNDKSFVDIFIRGVSLSVASMSELFLAFGYIIVACGIFNAVKQYSSINSGAIIKNTAAVEKLAKLSCIVVPREAMFGSSNLSVDKVYVPNAEYDLGKDKNESINHIITDAILSTGRYGAQEIKKGELFKNPDQEAVIAAGKKLSLYNIILDHVYTQIAHRAASASSLFDTTLVLTGGEYVAVSSGSSDMILAQCVSYFENGECKPMTEERRLEFRLQAISFAKRSFKVLAVASKKHAYNNLAAISRAQCDLSFEGFLALSSPLSLSVAQSVQNCKNAGIKTIMLCDDVNDSNVFFAQNIGVIEDETQTITGSELGRMRADLACTNALLYRMYSGLSQGQQKQLVLDLQKNKEFVGVLGSNLSDIESVEAADVGFAQNITISNRAGGALFFGDNDMSAVARNSSTVSKNGCEALKLSGDVIISDTDKFGNGGYNALVGAICSAKKIYLNIQSMIRYLLSVQTLRFALVFYSVLCGNDIPSALQILFSGLIVDLAAVMIIAFEKQTQRDLKVSGRIERQLSDPFWSNVDALLLGIAVAAVLILTNICLHVAGIGDSSGSRIFFALLLAQTLMLIQIKKDHAWFCHHTGINNALLLFITALFEFCFLLVLFPPLGKIFGVTALVWQEWLSLLAVAVIVFLLCELYRFVAKKIECKK